MSRFRFRLTDFISQREDQLDRPGEDHMDDPFDRLGEDHTEDPVDCLGAEVSYMAEEFFYFVHTYTVLGEPLGLCHASNEAP